MASSVTPETVAAACARRNNCRYGLGGLRMRHIPTGRRFECGGSTWGPDDNLLLRVGESGEVVPADQCVLLDRWPVTCCRPAPPRRRRQVAKAKG